MLKDRLAGLIGRNNYVRYIMFLTKLYHAFRPFRHRAVRLMRERLLFPGAVVLDIGANIGAFTNMAARIIGPEGRIHSFEPVPMVLRVLKAMVRLKRLRQVIVVEAALSDRNGRETITVPLKDGWKPLLPIAHLGGGATENAMRIEIEVKRLDDYCEAMGLDRVDFIKCDTEGSEVAVFSGGLKCLERSRPVVICEVYKDYLARQKKDPVDLFGIFQSLGYRAWLINPGGDLTPVTGYVAPADYLFAHPSKPVNAA